MAAPMVAGAAAIILQAHPDWTPDQVKGTLMSHAALAARARPACSTSSAAVNPGPGGPVTANRGLTPNTMRRRRHRRHRPHPLELEPLLVEPGRRDALTADWARSSWSCTCSSTTQTVDPTRSSWSRSTWSSGLDL